MRKDLENPILSRVQYRKLKDDMAEKAAEKPKVKKDILLTYKGREYALVGIKCMLRPKDGGKIIWPHLLEILETVDSDIIAKFLIRRINEKRGE